MVDVLGAKYGNHSMAGFPHHDFRLGILRVFSNSLFDDINAPDSSQSTFSYVFDNDAGGATFDFFFNSDPLGAGETAWFKVWTDKTANSNDWFDIEIYPTATVPVPSAIILLGSGLACLLGIRRRIGKAVES